MANLIDDGEDFSNNLASDIAPLLALFGEQVTMQFLRAAEICEFICIYRRDPGKRCINSARIMDIQQAMIEPCLLKKSSQQPHGVMQRLPCWLDNALTFARHWFKDAWEKSNCYCDLESANGDGKLQAPAAEPPVGHDEIVIVRNRQHRSPNISLNSQMDRHRWSLWICAVIGIVLQGGVLVFFGLITEYRTLKFEKDGQPVEDYAMPLSITSTVFLVCGMLACGYVVEKGSEETVYEIIDAREDTHRRKYAMAMIWLQNQTTVSEQRFSSAAIYHTVERLQARISTRAYSDHTENSPSSHGQSESQKPQIGLSRPAEMDLDRLTDNIESTDTSGKEPPSNGQIGENHHHQIRKGKVDNTGPRNKQKESPPIQKTRKGPGHRMKLFIDFGALISVLGIGGQFTGLRGMHWLASIAQLSASIIIAFVRAVIRRYLAQPAKHETIQDPGFEMEWFILSLRNIEDAIWLPKVPPRTQLLDYIRGIFFRENRKLAAPAKPINEENTTWVILSGTTECLSWTNTESNAQSEASADLESTEDKRNATDPSKLRSQDQKPQRAYTKIEDLSSAQGVLDLRRSLGELGHWKGPAYAEALKGLTGSTAAFGLSKS
ncbi:hypothetical protein CGGC5_v009979 [Colletotrichum fructicola Nara gc5]|uniref:Uncharacterized protein n=1 Tax=Colletotrichum fructicola (strain Nara gc5) TaxID=1213859 RepID=A0A7J6IWZ2_COLFN|nr:hypothetical protein CGGC5_v009979 [Colletotrichum fructicola Nara gc5]